MLAATRSSIGRVASNVYSGVGSFALPFLRYLHGAVPMDGNTAAAHVAYGMSELHTIFPITPASSMGEAADEWNTAKRKNMFGKITSVTEMESEMGVAGSVHGAAMAGALVSTFTSSQGLLLMIPNLYRLAGGLYPAVIHVAARCVAGQSLAIYPDHSDVMSTRMTGTAMMCSNSVQEAMDLAAVSHMAAIKSSMPFLHFFDGFKTSHEVNTVVPISYDKLFQMFDHQAHADFRARALSNDKPDTRGTIQNADHMFQIIEASQPYINRIPGVVEECMDRLAKETGRQYKLFDYYGAQDADRVIVILGSGAHPVKEIIDYLGKKGEKVGVVMVRLYRPFAIDRFINILPKTVKKIAVLDRTREALAAGDPLYLDVKGAIPNGSQIEVVGGRYGIGGKEFTPVMAKAVFDNLKSQSPKDKFLVGIEDDLCHRSLPIDKQVVDATPEGTTQCLFWGLGADGTVGANKQAIKIIGTETDDLHGQGNFVYSAHKSGGITISHLRFGPKPQLSSYNITNADYIAVHAHPYLLKYTGIIDPIKVGGTFVLNSPYTSLEQMEQFLPNFVKRTIAERKVMLYNVNATELADKLGLQGKINMIMQSAFFNLSRVLPEKQAVELLKNAVKKEYGRKGEDIVHKNWEAIDESVKYLHQIKYPESWATLPDDREKYLAVPSHASEFTKSVYYPVQRMQGDDLPVSNFEPRGVIPPSMSNNEKRGFATSIAQWQNEEDCSQCNLCSALCPHAVIRPFLFTAQEAKAAGIGADFKKVKAKGGKTKGMDFSIQVSGYDCTGCGVCAQACPDGVIELLPAEQVRDKAQSDFQRAQLLPNHTECFDIETLKGSQFVKPFLEFNGACAGCPQTAPLKMLTQLFGEDMYISNQAGCTCVWLSTYPVSALTTNKDGMGPTYGQGLFEDGAEFGFGMFLATETRRENLKQEVKDLIKSENSKVTPKLKQLLSSWVESTDDRVKCKQLSKEIKTELDNVNETDPSSSLYRLKNEHGLLRKKTQWLLGGDGWAYDINFQGVDHVLAQGQKVNVLVMDNEVYANTGGQASKATPRSSMAKFAMGGKKTPKKDLGAMMMTYGNIYVASICMDADPQQAMKALKEAEAYPGPSLVINYAPCINHGITGGLGNAVDESKQAVEEGYVVLYRYNPTLNADGKNPLTIDSTPKKGLDNILKNEVRYHSLSANIPEADAHDAHTKLGKDLQDRFQRYQKMASK